MTDLFEARLSSRLSNVARPGPETQPSDVNAFSKHPTHWRRSDQELQDFLSPTNDVSGTHNRKGRQSAVIRAVPGIFNVLESMKHQFSSPSITNEIDKNWPCCVCRDAVLRNATTIELNEKELFTLSISSVIVGGFSLVSAIIAVASFLRMRRSFRHDLILLLILSDMLKTLWLVVLPATQLVQGTVASTSNLCQISGYFLSVGIESCDFTVLLMAAHTGLYIFRGRTGLYPYRFPAYAVVAIVSLTLASLAFINKPAFVNLGPYCYLPTEPSWTNRVLSWIPRYVVVATIMLTYTCIYAYVRWVMKKSEKPGQLRNTDVPCRVDGHHAQESYPLPPTPPIAYHGLIPPSPPCIQELCGNNWDRHSRQDNRTRTASLSKQQKESTQVNSGDDPEQGRFSAIRWPVSAVTRPSSSRDAAVSAVSISLERTRRSLYNHGSQSSHDNMLLPHLVLSPTTVNATGLPESRDKVRRQLGQLFVYPLVYMTGWLIPFIYHVMGGSQTSRPFWLVLASLISLCAQGVADSAVFLMMEKPWRYWKKEDISFWCCLPWSKQSSLNGHGIKVGRTRDEMLIDGTLARTRREREQAEWGSGLDPPIFRDWWDLTLVGIDESSDEDVGMA